METVYTFKTARFALELAIEPEYNYMPDWDFESDEERDALIERIETGRTLWFVARVRVLLDGREIATDYLGGCGYNTIEEFRRDGYFYDMARSAIKDARATLRNMPHLRAA
jgi:hypothetical protein